MRSMVALRMASAPGMLTAALAATRACARERRRDFEVSPCVYLVETEAQDWKTGIKQSFSLVRLLSKAGAHHFPIAP